jgi:peptidoglycan/xylan/chitin deacetylase (PgdA/CDA1 family)
VKQALMRSGLKALDVVTRARWFDRVERSASDTWLRVLTYHRVAPANDPSLCPGLFSITPEGLEHQLRNVASRYATVSLDDVLACQRGGAVLPKGALLITFDDGYRDFEQHAWPVLRRLGLPAVLFVPTAYPDAPDRAFWWDRLHAGLMQPGASNPLATSVGSFPVATPAERMQALKQLKGFVKRLPAERAASLVDEVCDRLDAPAPAGRVLGWDALRQLANAGLAVCAHTRTHPQLDRVSRETAREEIRGSIADLKRELGSSPPAFAYPDGRLRDDVVEVLEEEGVELAFTTQRGVNEFPARAPLRLERIPINARTSDSLLRVQLAFMRPRRHRGPA